MTEQQDDIELIQKSLKQSYYVSHSVESAEATQEKQEKVLIQQAEERQKRFKKGYDFLLQYIEGHANEGTFSVSESLPSALISEYRIPTTAEKTTSDIEQWKKQIENPIPIQEICAYSNNILLNFYEIASYFLTEKQQENAINSFSFLCDLNPNVASLWIGLGLSFESNKEYMQAMEALQKAISLEPSDFAPYLGMIRCCQELHDFTKVIECLEEAEKNPSTQNDAEEALEYIKQLQQGE